MKERIKELAMKAGMVTSDDFASGGHFAEKFADAIYKDIITVVAAQSLMGESAMDVFVNLKRIYEGGDPEPVAPSTTNDYDF